MAKKTDLSQLLGFSCTVLNWKPSDFWCASPAELFTCIDWYNKQHKTSKKDKMDMNSFLELKWKCESLSNGQKK